MKALQEKALSIAPQGRSQRKEAVCDSKPFIAMMEIGYPSSQGGPEINFCREECLGRKAYWLCLLTSR